MSFGQSDCSVFKLAISQEYQGQSAWFFHADIEWRKIKVDLKIFIGQVKNAIGESECIIPESTMS